MATFPYRVTHQIISVTLDEEFVYHPLSHCCGKKVVCIYKREGLDVFVDCRLRIRPQDHIVPKLDLTDLSSLEPGPAVP